ncbi:MAG: glutathione peroxidase [bacterium]|nr:glutathione peroxidase [bacterium]
MTDINGNKVSLDKFKGKVVLVVNVASECGLTPQYKGLQEIYSKYKDKGFTILGFPANNFGKQEPGNDSQIKSFCTTNYGVQFPMFSKISVLGDDIHPLYSYLTKDAGAEVAGNIRWNFDKFLADQNGNIIARFHPKTVPGAPEITGAIESTLEKK